MKNNDYILGTNVVVRSSALNRSKSSSVRDVLGPEKCQEKEGGGLKACQEKALAFCPFWVSMGLIRQIKKSPPVGGRVTARYRRSRETTGNWMRNGMSRKNMHVVVHVDRRDVVHVERRDAHLLPRSAPW